MGLLLAVTAFEWLEDAIGGEIWTYPALVVSVALDSLFPIAPGEAMMITAGVLAANGELILPFVILAGAAGSLLGDNASYGLGASLGRRAERRYFSSGRSRQRVEWARRQLQERGAVIIVAARFIPGGRTATTFSAGTLGMPWRRFVAIDAVAAGLWATYMPCSATSAAPPSRMTYGSPSSSPPRSPSSSPPPASCSAAPSSPSPTPNGYASSPAAPWRSGYAAACKAVYTSSILVGASAVFVPVRSG